MTPEKLTKKPSVSPEKRPEIVSISTIKLSERKISRQIKVGKTTVHKAIKKFQKEGTFADSKRSGRPKISSSGDECFTRKAARLMSSRKKNRLKWKKKVSKLVRRQLEVDY